MKHREVVTCPGHPVGWLGLGSPPVDPSRVQDEIRSVSFIHLFLASLLPFLVPLHSSGWCSPLLESSRRPPPRLPVGSWYYQGQLRKSRRWRQATQAADVRDASPGPERAQSGCFQSRILLPCGRSSVCPSPQDRADRGAKHWGPQSPASPWPGEHHSISVSVTF